MHTKNWTPSLETTVLRTRGTDMQFLLNTLVGWLTGDKIESKEATAGH